MPAITEVKISGLPNYISPLSNTDILPLDQVISSVLTTVQAPISALQSISGWNAGYFLGVPIVYATGGPFVGEILQFNGSTWSDTDLSSAGALSAPNNTGSGLWPITGEVPYAIGAGGLGMDFNTNFTYDASKNFLTVGGIGFNDTTQAGLELNNLNSTQVSDLTLSEGDLWINTSTACAQLYNGTNITSLLGSAITTPGIGVIPYIASPGTTTTFSANFNYSGNVLSVQNIAFNSISNVGLRLNQLTTAEIGSLASPGEGWMPYNTNIHAPVFYNGTTYVSLLPSAAQWNAAEIQSIPVSATPPITGQSLVYNGSEYIPTSMIPNVVITIGTGGTYPDYSTAFTALCGSGGQFDFLQVSNVTESANYTFTADCIIFIQIVDGLNYNSIDVSAFNLGTTNSFFNFFSNNAGYINYQFTSSTNWFDATNADYGALYMTNINLTDQTSASVSSYGVYAPSGNFYVQTLGLSLAVANSATSGITANTGFMSNTTVYGSGTSTSNVINFSGQVTCNDILFLGEFDETNSTVVLTSGYINGSANNANNIVTLTANMGFPVIINNLIDYGDYFAITTGAGTQLTLSNVPEGCNITLGAKTLLQMFNVQVLNGLTLNDTSTVNNCQINGGNLLISANKCFISNTYVGAAGSPTITFDVGATYNVLNAVYINGGSAQIIDNSGNSTNQYACITGG